MVCYCLLTLNSAAPLHRAYGAVLPRFAGEDTPEILPCAQRARVRGDHAKHGGGGRDRAAQCTRISILPKLSPCNRSTSPCGAFSSPSRIVSRHVSFLAAAREASSPIAFGQRSMW